ADNSAHDSTDIVEFDYAVIHGTVFRDTNGNGVKETDEPGIPDVLITLDGLITTTTDLDGNYTFSTTVTGVHTVVETDPRFYTPVIASPADPRYYFSTTPNEVHLDVSLGSSRRVDCGDTPICYADIYEDDDTPLQAREFTVGTREAHQFCDDAADWVRIRATAHTVYTITTSAWGQRADTVLALFDADVRTLLAVTDDYKGTTDYSSRIVWKALKNDVYYVRTTNRAGLTGHHTDYDLVIESEEPPTIYLPLVMRNHSEGNEGNEGYEGNGDNGTDNHTAVLHPTGVISHTCPDEYEPDDTWEQAHAIVVGVIQTHSFDSDPRQYAADKDFIWFETSTLGWGTIIFTTTPMTGTQTVMELYDEEGDALIVSGTTRLVWAATAGGRYYLSVSPEDEFTSFGCADAVGYNLLMETLETNFLYLPLVTRSQ
ncbi:MAG: hypothetical protein DRI80_13480, partial [Chloroflexota bacterium]